jgi:hypothetical protein
MQVQFHTNKVMKKRVYLEPSDTVYAGYAVCYNHDTTEDMDGSTVAEGSQCNGKFLRVEKPAAANLDFLAGFVAPESNGVVGPKWITIIEPMGCIIPAYISANAVLGETKLFLQDASYVLGSDGGRQVGLAMETVDRSSTNGVALARVQMPDMSIAFGANSGIGPSKTLWNDCPWDEIVKDPNIGHSYFTHYLDPIDVTNDDGYDIDTVTSGAIDGVATIATGALLVDSAGNASEDDGINVQLTNCGVLPTASTEIWFEARVQMNDTSALISQFFVGLCEVQTAIIASGALEDTDDKCGFFRQGDTTGDRLESVTARAAADDITADVATVADATWVKLGFKITGLSTVEFYVDGVLVETGSTAANIPNKLMVLSYVAQTQGASKDAELTIDWVRIAQKN